MSLRVRTLLTFAILAVIAACGQTQQPKAAPPSNPVQQPGVGDRPLAQVPAAQRANTWKSAPPMTIDVKKNYVATLTTSKGIIVVALDASAAPQTVNNFVFLVNQGFYDGLTFHRVVSGFVIQGGDPLGTGTGGPGYTVPAEIKLPHVEGAIAMARLGDQQNPQRASSGSQFYITLAPTPNLDGAYTAFGQVTSGMDVVKKIQIGDVIQKIVISGQ
jgi:peptidyl-prolyl cis-trans isomerase B (cyclophilin B)